MATKLCRMLTCLDELLSIKSDDCSSRGLARSRGKLNNYITIIRMLMATKLGKMVKYLEGLQTIKLFNALITWFYKIT